MQNDQFHTIKPKHPLIAAQVDYYYFQLSTSPKFQQSYIYYPHYMNALNVYIGADISWNEKGRQLTANPQAKASCILTMSRKKSRIVEMKGAQQKLGIIFKSLGLNHFITQPLNRIQSDTVGYFDHFGTDFTTLATELFQEPDLDQRAHRLDQALLKYYHDFHEARLQKALRLIFHHNTDIEVQDIAKQAQTSRRTLLRLFQRHLGCSINTFKAIVQFRMALHQYLEAQAKPKLAHIAYDNAYYDQSHFIHHFQTVTGLSPQKLFQLITAKSQESTYWAYHQ